MQITTQKMTSAKVFWNRILHNRLAMFGGIVFLLIVLLSVFANFIAPYEYMAIDPANKFMMPCAEHLFGTDQYGRDIFSRVIYGGRWSLTLGLVTTIISTIGAIIVGSIAGYFGGTVDAVIMRIIDVIQCVPGSLLTIIIATMLGSGLLNTCLALSFGAIWGGARLLRGQILTVRNQEYVEAARATNVKPFRIIIRYVLPNSIQPLIINACMSIGGTIMSASGLSFLGIGIQPPLPEWGAMLNDSLSSFRHYPYLMVAPLIFISLTVLSISLFGDGLRDALDPRMNA